MVAAHQWGLVLTSPSPKRGSVLKRSLVGMFWKRRWKQRHPPHPRPRPGSGVSLPLIKQINDVLFFVFFFPGGEGVSWQSPELRYWIPESDPCNHCDDPFLCCDLLGVLETVILPLSLLENTRAWYPTTWKKYLSRVLWVLHSGIGIEPESESKDTCTSTSGMHTPSHTILLEITEKKRCTLTDGVKSLASHKHTQALPLPMSRGNFT